MSEICYLLGILPKLNILQILNLFLSHYQLILTLLVGSRKFFLKVFHLLYEKFLILESFFEDKILFLLSFEVELEQYLVFLIGWLDEWSFLQILQQEVVILSFQSHSLIFVIFNKIQILIMKKQGKKNNFAQKFSEESQNYSQQDNQENNDGYPIQLLQIKKSGEITINAQALEIIASADKPVGFVSLVGKMRTGKSFLLNKVLNLSKEGFKVDSSTQSCTKGIWIWSSPYLNTIHNNYIYFIDTQGTASMEKDNESDTKIFTLAVLISSYFIYNSVGNIDQMSLSELELVTELSKQIKTGDQGQSKGENYHLHQHMPKFLWLLRDFVLKIQDNRGRKITATQYLQNSLNESNGAGRVGQKSNKIKKSIMSFFVERQCLTLVRPVDDEDDLMRLDKIPEYKIRRQFIEGVNKLKGMIMQNAGPKTYQNQPISGHGMCCMIQSYVQAFNEGKVPNIKSAWQQIDDSEGQHAYNKALEKFYSLSNEQFQDNEPKGEQIHEIIAHIKEESLKQFEENSYNNKHEKYLGLLKQLLKQKQKEYLNTNSQMNEHKNFQIMSKLSQGLKTKIQTGHYNSQNIGELQKEIDDITKKYNAEGKGEKKGAVLSQFVTTIMPLVLNIKEDKTLQNEKIRQNELKLRQQDEKIKRLQQQNQSKQKQIESKDNANEIIKNKPTKASRVAQKQKAESGCCAGGKCQIM